MSFCANMSTSEAHTSESDSIVKIDWNVILDRQQREFTPKSIRAYLAGVIQKMNYHFAVIMFSSPEIGKIRVTRYSRNEAEPDFITISMFKARSLFSQRINCRWTENGKQKKIFKKAIDFWISSSNRKELYFQPVKITQVKSQPVKQFIELLMTSEASLQLPGLNTRTSVYELWENAVTTPSDWNPKSISAEIYRVIPMSRPTKRKRVRRNGISMIYLPSKEILFSILKCLNDNNTLLFYINFVIFYLLV